MKVGSGIAIAGIWLAVGAIGFHNGIDAVPVGLFALFATLAVTAAS